MVLAGNELWFDDYVWYDAFPIRLAAGSAAASIATKLGTERLIPSSVADQRIG